ncbi:DUF397 domain-containing protein [Actinoplanes sp. NPDC020271]|uniref:DUF397 domain-containing protein n=1 Tax=Actinoplanes sp. NPDC020271 TaxID=3363896 RepID=UPI0037BCCA28
MSSWKQAETPEWRTSTKSGGSNCVEVAHLKGRVLVRDSKDRDGTVLTFDLATWNSFLDFVSTHPASVEGTN